MIKPERAKARLDLGVAFYSSYNQGPVGGTIWSETRWLFSSQWLKCPWLRVPAFGPRVAALHPEYEQILKLPEESWDPIYEAFGGNNQEVWNLVNAAKHLYEDQEDRSAWAYPGGAFYGHQPAVTREMAQAVISKLLQLLGTKQRIYLEYKRTVKQAEKEDKLEENFYPKSDGPPWLVIVKNEPCHGYREDPQCFGGDRWITVAPPEDWSPSV